MSCLQALCLSAPPLQPHSNSSGPLSAIFHLSTRCPQTFPPIFTPVPTFLICSAVAMLLCCLVFLLSSYRYPNLNLDQSFPVAFLIDKSLNHPAVSSVWVLPLLPLSYPFETPGGLKELENVTGRFFFFFYKTVYKPEIPSSTGVIFGAFGREKGF